MVTTTAAVTPGETVNQGELAAALRAAGLAEVETATRRRAEYSSDASNYRVVPEVVAFPRSADEIVAALGRLPRAERADRHPRRRHLDRRQRALDRPRARPVAAPQPGAARRPRAADGAGRAGDRARRHHRRRRAARAPLRPGSLHPLAGHHRRRDRQQRLRLAGAAVRPDRRQRDRAGRGHRHRHALHGRARARRRARPGRRGAGRPGRRTPDRPARPGRREPGHDQDRVRPVHPAGVRLLARAPAAGERRRRRQVPVRHRGHPRADPAGHRPPGRRAARDRAGGARLPGHGVRRRGGARAAAAPAGRPRGPRLPDGRRGPDPARPGRRARPAARRRLAVRRDRRRHAWRRPARPPASSSPTAAAWTAR